MGSRPNLVQVNWETQKNVLFNSLATFRSKEIHTDITLSCEGENFLAHKLVLSMCSGYFKRALNTSSPASVVVLFGLRKCILEALLNFLYDGTTTIRNDDIPDLLTAGKHLEIPGLMDMSNSGNYIPSNSPRRNDVPQIVRTSSLSSFSQEIRNPSEQMNFTRNSLEGMDITRNSSGSLEFPRKIKTEIDVCSPVKHVKEINIVASKKKAIHEHHEAIESVDFIIDSEDDESNPGNVTLINSGRLNNNLSSKKNKKELDFNLTNISGTSKMAHKCEICGNTFSNLSSLQDHMDLHAAEPEPCNHCGQKFSSQRVYATHVRKCVKEKTSKRQQNNSCSMRKRNKTEDSEDIISNNILGLKSQNYINKSGILDTRSNKNKIVDVEQVNENNVICDEKKNEKLANCIHLKRSIATFNNRYCKVCNQVFPTITKYKDHRRIDCKVLECQYCLREYVIEKKNEYKNHVKSHEELHLKVKNDPFSCPDCNFTTTASTFLENHRALHHTGIYTFWCPLCEFQAMKYSELKTHTKSEHPEVIIDE